MYDHPLTPCSCTDGEHKETKEKHGTIDAIVSSIPIANLKKEEAFSLLTNWNDLLKPNGICIQYQYSLLTQKLFKQVFSNTKIYFEPRNIPPAFLYRGMKKAPL
jgi:phospholipid N-methyltransferase